MAKRKVSSGGRKIEDVMQILSDEGQRAQLFFGLTDWDIHYRLGGVDETAEACCEFDSISLVSTVRLNDDLDINVWDNDWYIWDIARHEVLHLLFADLQLVGTARELTSDVIGRRIHRAINRIVFPLSGAPLPKIIK